VRPRLAVLDGAPGAALVFAAALGSFAVQSYVWPLYAGRDWQDYVIWWHEVGQAEPLFPALMSTRAPLAPLFFGPLLELGGAALTEAAAAVLYATTVVLWAATARRYGRFGAAALALLLVVPPTFGLFFRQVGSDPVFGFALALVAWLAARANEAPSSGRFALVGAGVAASVLTRPSALPLLLLVLLPLVAGRGWGRRVRWAGAVVAAAIAPLAAYAVYNHIRFDDFSVARGGGSGIPAYRSFVVDRIVERRNGPATRELAAAIRDDLLRREPYRSLGFEVEDVLTSGLTWVYDDVVALADRTRGWDDDHRILLEVGLEAVRAHPGEYAGGVLTTLGELLFERYSGPPGAGRVGVLRGEGDPPGPVTSAASIALVNNWALTAPEPEFRVVGGTAPRTGVVWSPFEKRDLEWEDPADDRRYEELRGIVLERLEQLSGGPRHPRGDPPLRAMMHLTPGIGYWLAAAALLWLVRRPRGLWVPFLLALASSAVLLETALGFPADRNYAAPFLPVAMLLFLAVAGRILPAR
jgi:hypothetical protein